MVDLVHGTTDKYLLGEDVSDSDIWDSVEDTSDEDEGNTDDANATGAERGNNNARNTRRRLQGIIFDDDDDEHEELDYGEAAEMRPVHDNMMLALLRHLFGAQVVLIANKKYPFSLVNL